MKTYEAERYPVLRMCLRENKIDLRHSLPKILGISGSSVYASMSGKRDWRQSEMFKIMDIIHKPNYLIHLIFSGEERQGIYNKATMLKVIETEVG